MKQKIFYIVLLVAGMYLPSSSKECGKVLVVIDMKNELPATEKASAMAEDVSSLPVSPFSGSLLNL